MEHKQFAELIKQDAELQQIFAYWCNMIGNWKLRVLHGFVNADTIERCVGFSMCFVANNMKEGEKLALYINPARPNEFAYNIGDVWAKETMVVQKEFKLLS